MGREKSPIGLRLPDRKKPGREAFDTRPQRVEAWVQALPLANVGETARRLYGTLQEVNGLRIRPADRYAFLELLRPPIAYITDALRRHFVGRSFPLAEKSLRIAALTRELHTEMALGYKIIADDLARRSVLFRNRRLLAHALQRTLYHMGRIQLTAYQVYATPPARTWRDIHRVYAYAESRRLQRKRIPEQRGEQAIRSSVEKVYKHLLLLAIASPYRLRQGEVQIVDRLLDEWAASATLHRPRSETPEAGLFRVRLDKDEEPAYNDVPHEKCKITRCRLFDADPVVDRAREALERKKSGKSSPLQKQLGPGLSEDLLRRLIDAWGTPAKRGDEREYEGGMVTVALGLLMLHNSLLETANDSSAAEKFSDRASFAGHEAFAEVERERSKRDVWDMRATTSENPTKPAQPAAPTMPSAPTHPQLWRVSNVSRGGYCLRHEGDQTGGGVHVGELVGVRHHDEPWEVATVRWIKHPSDKVVELGVQVLGRAATAVAASRQDQHDAQYQRGLLMPATDAGPESLIVPALLFNHGETLTLHGAGEPWRLRLGEPLETGGSFARFEFEPLDEHPKETAPPASQESGEFGNLWSEL